MTDNSLFTLLETERYLPYILVFGVGACVGSFLNVCILRIPHYKSVIYPGSQCQCGIPIPAWNNLPLFSWLILRGKAPCCGQKFSVRYPLIELLTAVLFTLQWHFLSTPLIYISYIFTFILIAVTFIDLDHMIIPDRFSIGGAILGLLLSFCIPEMHGHQPSSSLQNHFLSAYSAIIGIIVGTAISYWIATLFEILLNQPALGEGDVKLLACIGAFCGWQGTVFSLFAGAIIGLLLVIPALIIFRIQKKETDPMIPFGPMLAIAAWLHFHFLSDWTTEYFENLVLIIDAI